MRQIVVVEKFEGCGSVQRPRIKGQAAIDNHGLVPKVGSSRLVAAKLAVHDPVMILTWVNLSARWELTSVQAALGLIISVLGTTGIWTFSRYFWQRGSIKIIRGDDDVPLSTVFVISNLGEVWDVVSMLRDKLIARKRWNLALQIVVIVLATAACTFSGPIAKSSLRSIPTVHRQKLDVLLPTKGDSWTGNTVQQNVQWNNTLHSMDAADFPLTQLLDFLPPSTVPWTYREQEWDATWAITCDNTHETTLHGLTASGNFTFDHPIEAYKGFRDTYDPKWFNRSRYRPQVDNGGWFVNEPVTTFKDYFFYVLFISDPAVDDRMHSNNETMEVSISILHLSDFNATNTQDVSWDAQENFILSGGVGMATFTRAECNFTRNWNSSVDEDAVPWLWTNDTSAITTAYKDFWWPYINDYSPKGLTVPTPSAKDIIRLFQAYTISVNTVYSSPVYKTLSTSKPTVQIVLGVLFTLSILFILVLCSSARYAVFLHRNKKMLEKMNVPDSKLEWMVHGAKLSEEELGASGLHSQTRHDRDFFRSSTFGYTRFNAHEEGGHDIQRLVLPRIRTKRAGKSPCSLNGKKPGGVSVIQLRKPAKCHLKDPMTVPESSATTPSADACSLLAPKTADLMSLCTTITAHSDCDRSEASKSRRSSVEIEERQLEPGQRSDSEAPPRPILPEILIHEA